MKGYKVKSLIKADDKINQVSAASIIAKSSETNYFETPLIRW